MERESYRQWIRGNFFEIIRNHSEACSLVIILALIPVIASLLMHYNVLHRDSHPPGKQNNLRSNKLMLLEGKELEKK